MKTIEIEIQGAASEIVVGKLSMEELERIHTVMAENDLVEDADSDEPYYNYASFYYASSLVEEAGVSEWHDTDELLHQHGSYTGGTIIVRNFETKAELYNGELSDLLKDNDYEPEIYHFKKDDLEENEMFLFARTSEKGMPFLGRIDVEDDHIFDIKRLAISCISAKIDDMELGEIIEYIMYDYEDVNNDYYQTYGKDFEVAIF